MGSLGTGGYRHAIEGARVGRRACYRSWDPLISRAPPPLGLSASNGVSVNAWLYNGTLPGPALRVLEGQTLRVRFTNQLPESSKVHWHEQPVQLGMDGVPGISRPAVAPRQEFLYELPNLTPGTYWFHPHGYESQLDVGRAMRHGARSQVGRMAAGNLPASLELFA
jgi:hypothetical protein